MISVWISLSGLQRGMVSRLTLTSGWLYLLSHLSPFYSNLIGLTAVNISRVVFQARPHWSGLFGIISHM